MNHVLSRGGLRRVFAVCALALFAAAALWAQTVQFVFTSTNTTVSQEKHSGPGKMSTPPPSTPRSFLL
jgi:hypothetical protein